MKSVVVLEAVELPMRRAPVLAGLTQLERVIVFAVSDETPPPFL